jgi:hypothetical protein
MESGYSKNRLLEREIKNRLHYRLCGARLRHKIRFEPTMNEALIRQSPHSNRLSQLTLKAMPICASGACTVKQQFQQVTMP